MTPDFINSLFEFFGCFFILLNIKQILEDKLVRGVNILTIVFWTTWGLWNLYYYPHLGQTLSFYAGCLLVFLNTIYLILLIYYKRKENV